MRLPGTIVVYYSETSLFLLVSLQTYSQTIVYADFLSEHSVLRCFYFVITLMQLCVFMKRGTGSQNARCVENWQLYARPAWSRTTEIINVSGLTSVTYLVKSTSLFTRLHPDILISLLVPHAHTQYVALPKH